MSAPARPRASRAERVVDAAATAVAWASAAGMVAVIALIIIGVWGAA